MECSCQACVSACSYRPGWFAPGEAEKAAELKGMSLQEFFKAFLGVDWWQGEPTTFVLAPATVSMDPGEEYPGNPKGRCVFLVDGRCSIHAAKPEECRLYDHTKTRSDSDVARRSIVARWRERQGQFKELLGRDPVEAEAEFGFGLWF